MAKDYVTIANLALSKLGEDDQIRAPDQDSHAARSIAAVWDAVRRGVLRDHPWNFGSTRAELASEANPAKVIYPWQFRFPHPDGLCRLVEILGPRIVRDDYENEDGGILANHAGPIYIRFIRDVPEIGLWDELFVEAFAERLAFQVADRITGSQSRQDRAWNRYLKALSKAKGVDAKENPPVETEETSWETARYGS